MRKILVTGGNKGIGYAVCLTLLRDFPDTYVLLGSRDLSRGQAAVEQLASQVPTAKDRIEFLLLDVSSPDSVKEAASRVDGPLFGIVNNAAIGATHTQATTMATNYFGVKRVNDAFLPKLQSPAGRVVNVSSGAAPMYVSGLSDDDPIKAQLTQPWLVSGMEAVDELATSYKVKDEGPGSYDSYGFSKALVNCYTWWLARQHPDLVINAVTPGFIDTDLTASVSSNSKKTPEQGAVPIIHCLFDEQVANSPQGRYYGSDGLRSPLHTYRDPGSPAYDGPDGPSS